MIFEALHEAAVAGELILVHGGFCHYHRRRDGWVTICEILVLPDCQRQGIGVAMLEALRGIHPVGIRARCPADLPSNDWYERMGFRCVATLTTKTGRAVNVWEWRP